MGLFSQNPEFDGDIFDNERGIYYEQNLLKCLRARDGLWHSLFFTASWKKDGDAAVEAVMATLQRYQYKIVSADIQPVDIVDGKVRGTVHIIYR